MSRVDVFALERREQELAWGGIIGVGTSEEDRHIKFLKNFQGGGGAMVRRIVKYEDGVFPPILIFSIELVH